MNVITSIPELISAALEVGQIIGGLRVAVKKRNISG
jgi:hypothetical protein